VLAIGVFMARFNRETWDKSGHTVELSEVLQYPVT
jgi:hypothetical protein